MISFPSDDTQTEPDILRLMMELFKFNCSLFSEDLRQRVYNFYFDHFLNQLADLTPVLGLDIGKNLEHQKIFSEYYLFRRLCESAPDSVDDLLPDLIDSNRSIENKWYCVYWLVKNHPVLLERDDYRPYFETLFQVVTTKHVFRQTIEALCTFHQPSFNSMILSSRNKQKEVFMSTIDDNKFANDVHFSPELDFIEENLDLFSDEELCLVIDQILNNLINFNPNVEVTHPINSFFLNLGWQKRDQIFEKYLDFLKQHEFHQVIEEYFFRHPELITKNREYILQNFERFTVGPHAISDTKIDFLQITDPIRLFKERFKCESNFALRLTQIIYKHFQEHKAEMIEAIMEEFENYNFSQIPFSKNEYGKTLTWDPTSILLSTQYPPTPELPIKFVNMKLKEFFQNPEQKTNFFLTVSPYLAKNWTGLEGDIRKTLWQKVIDEPNSYYNCARFASFSPENFRCYLDEFLEINPQNLSESINYSAVLRILLIKVPNDADLQVKIVQKLISLPGNSISGNILSYCGNFENSISKFDEFFAESADFPFTQILRARIEQIISEIEIELHSFSSFKNTAYQNEISEIWAYIEKYEKNQDERAQSRLKFNIIQLRLKFLQAKELLFEMRYDEVIESFQSLEKKYQAIAEIHGLPDHTKKMLSLNSKLSRLFAEISQSIKTPNGLDLIAINRIFQRKITQLKESEDLNDIRTSSIFSALEKCEIDDLYPNKCHFQMPNPGIGCPIPDRIKSIRLVEENTNSILYEWDKNLNSIPSYKPIPLDDIFSRSLSLSIEFEAEKLKWGYEVEFHSSENLIEINLDQPMKPRKEKDQDNNKKECLKLDFRLKTKQPFSNTTKILFTLKEDNPCFQPRQFSLEIQDQTHIQTQIDQILSNIKTKSPECYETLIKDLKKHDFISKHTTVKEAALKWLDLIQYFIGLLQSFYDFEDKFRKHAKKWRNEATDMNPFMGSIFRTEFQYKYEEHPGISGGHCDHYIDKIPVEDKILQPEECPQSVDPIDFMFQKHKKQVFRESGKVGYGILEIADQSAMKSNIPKPICDCLHIYYENNTWIAVFRFQIFDKTPSKA